MVVLDGSENFNYSWYTASPGVPPYLVTRRRNTPFAKISGEFSKSDRFIFQTVGGSRDYNIYTIGGGIANDRYINIRLSNELVSEQSVDGYKAYLSAHPLIIFYKSDNYTPEADIAVALESYKSFYKTFDGTEEFTLAYSGEEANEYDLVLSGAGTILDTSSDDNASCSHFKKDNGVVDGNWQAFYMNNLITIQFFRSKTDCPDVGSFKQWLQEEYEKGTPVQCVMNRTTAVTYAHLAQPESIPAYYGFEEFVDAIAGEDVTGRWLTFTNDGEQLNFKGGGALSKAKLDLATAEADDVRQGLTFYAKGKELKTGVVPSFDYNVDAKGTEHFQNKLRILFDPGFYGKYGQSVPDPGVTFDAGDAGVGDVLEGKTFSSNGPGAKAAGQMPERGKWNGTYSGSDVVIPEGHHSGSGSVSVAGGNRGAWSGTYSGSNVTIPQGYHSGGGSVSVAGGNRGNWGATINPGGSVTIPQGYHAGGGVVRSNGGGSWPLRHMRFDGNNQLGTYTVGAPDGEGTYVWVFEGIVAWGNANSGLEFHFFENDFGPVYGERNSYITSGKNYFTSSAYVRVRYWGGFADLWYIRIA